MTDLTKRALDFLDAAQQQLAVAPELRRSASMVGVKIDPSHNQERRAILIECAGNLRIAEALIQVAIDEASRPQ